MSWWTRANLVTHDDRNRLNATVRKLVALAETLKYASKLIYQTARGARAMVGEVTANKTMTSFPEIKELLEEADKVALDSPQKFADLCKQAAQDLYIKVSELEDARHKFVRETLPGGLKGLRDDE